MRFSAQLSASVISLIVLVGCGSVSTVYQSNALHHRPLVSHLPEPTLTPADSNQVYEAVFEMSAAAVTSVSLSLRADHEAAVDRFAVPAYTQTDGRLCRFPRCSRIELPGRPPEEVARWLAIVDHWWKIRASRGGTRFKGMHRSFRDQVTDEVFFRQSILETAQVRPMPDVSCLLRRKVYVETEHQTSRRMVRELNRFRERHRIPRPMVGGPLIRWSGEGVIRAIQIGDRHRLELHYGLVHPDPSGGQFMSTSMVCTAPQPIWAHSMGSIMVNPGRNPLSLTIDYIPAVHGRGISERGSRRENTSAIRSDKTQSVGRTSRPTG